MIGRWAVTHRGAAGDWYTLFGPTLDVSFNTGAERAVNWRPHVSFLQETRDTSEDIQMETHQTNHSTIRPSVCLFSNYSPIIPSIIQPPVSPSIPPSSPLSVSPCRSCSGLCSTSPPPPSRRTDTPRNNGHHGNSPAESIASCRPRWNPGKKTGDVRAIIWAIFYYLVYNDIYTLKRNFNLSYLYFKSCLILFWILSCCVGLIISYHRIRNEGEMVK